VSRRRHQRRAEKARRHAQPPWETEQSWPAEKEAIPTPPRAALHAASCVERLAYTRSQAAEALGISRSTLRRLLPYIETIELPWGSELIPVDELERLVDERRRAPQPRDPGTRGRPPMVSPEVVERIRAECAAGKSLRRIAADLNTDGTPTAHGGQRWWPSTVRAVLVRS
jgi:Recombinase/Bacterial regulatory protein, Fis family